MASKNDNGQQDALTLLEGDHDTVRDLLSELDKTTSRGAKTRQELLKRIAKEVRIHATIEEEIFYPAYHEAAKTQEEEQLFFEASEEHGLVDIILPALEKTDVATVEFGARAKVLKDLIEHHAQEEEDEMFPKAKKLLGKARLLELGEQLALRKAQLSGGSRGAEMEPRGSKAKSGAAAGSRA
jgi:hemerythrin superfamily protein